MTRREGELIADIVEIIAQVEEAQFEFSSPSRADEVRGVYGAFYWWTFDSPFNSIGDCHYIGSESDPKWSNDFPINEENLTYLLEQIKAEDYFKNAV